MFRDDLLGGRPVALSPAARPALADRLAVLGARVGAERPEALVVDEPADELVAWSGRIWSLVRATAVGAWIGPGAAGGRIVLVAPPAGEAHRAALENLARTLSIEWARFGIRPTCVAPAPETQDATLADLVAYLLSPAGEYFSGCRFDVA